MNDLQRPIQVLLVDDEDIVRYGLKAIFKGTEEIEIIGEANNGQAAIELSEKLKPDVILMDIGMPLMDGLETTQRICQKQPHPKILILTTHDDAQNLSTAIQRGAVGYLLKNTPPEEFILSIRQVHKGYMQLGPGLGQKLGQQLIPSTPPSNFKPDTGITPREKDVLQLIAGGASNREIAAHLHITEKTVKNHVSSILSRVGVRDRTQLAIWANHSNHAVPQSPSQLLAS